MMKCEKHMFGYAIQNSPGLKEKCLYPPLRNYLNCRGIHEIASLLTDSGSNYQSRFKAKYSSLNKVIDQDKLR